MKKKKLIKKILPAFLILISLGAACVFGINSYVIASAKGRIISREEARALGDVDCILVLGCMVYSQYPSYMLSDRLQTGISLYEEGAAPKLLMSGDHGRIHYDEVNVMKQAAIDAGIPSRDVFMDHAGFSTYESLYRARDIFKAEKIIIVTQKYHLYRALHIAKKLGLEAYGVDATSRTYGGEAYREMREVLARNKDFLYAMFKPKPTFLGEAIPVYGDGDLTNDKELK
ncbi:MAG: SanA/YdcF family protein [Oscillospiraceae bacterium]|jgi:SanA protein